MCKIKLFLCIIFLHKFSRGYSVYKFEGNINSGGGVYIELRQIDKKVLSFPLQKIKKFLIQK